MMLSEEDEEATQCNSKRPSSVVPKVTQDAVQKFFDTIPYLFYLYNEDNYRVQSWEDAKEREKRQ